MKHLTKIFVFIGLFGILSCETDDMDSVVPNCEVFAQNIQTLIETENPTQTRVEWSGMFSRGPWQPTFDGCIMELDGRSWNLEQIVSYELNGDELLLVFT